LLKAYIRHSCCDTCTYIYVTDNCHRIGTTKPLQDHCIPVQHGCSSLQMVICCFCSPFLYSILTQSGYQNDSQSLIHYWVKNGSVLNIKHTCFAHSLKLKMGVTYSFQMSVYFQQTTWRYIKEDRTLHNYRCENLKSLSLSLSHSHKLSYLLLPFLSYSFIIYFIYRRH
jgi:hypothetical protein